MKKLNLKKHVAIALAVLSANSSLSLFASEPNASFSLEEERREECRHEETINKIEKKLCKSLPCVANPFLPYVRIFVIDSLWEKFHEFIETGKIARPLLFTFQNGTYTLNEQLIRNELNKICIDDYKIDALVNVFYKVLYELVPLRIESKPGPCLDINLVHALDMIMSQAMFYVNDCIPMYIRERNHQGYCYPISTENEGGNGHPAPNTHD